MKIKEEPIRKHRGTCRFYAPRGQHALWPLFPEVDETLWCGEWQPADRSKNFTKEHQACNICTYFRPGSLK